MMHSFHGYTAPPAILDGVRRGEITAFCLFAHMNVESLAQVRALNEQLIEAARGGGLPPPLLGIDQEGGQLMAITGGATELPGNMALGATRSPELARQAGIVLARELRALGFNLNFAPSLDVNSNPHNPVIGIRSFGDDAEWVARLGVALIDGLQAEGMIASAKHFPGHGDISTDTHFDAPTVTHPRKHLEQVELYPFNAAIRGGVKSVMSAHILYTALDAAAPATLSRPILTDLLRDEMGFDGLILTDAMDMHAVAKEGAFPSVKGALDAGADLVLLAHLPDQFGLAREAAALENARSLTRIASAREAVPRDLPSLDIVGCAEHQQVAQNIADHAITVVKDDDCLPLRPAPEETIVVITPAPADLTPADTSSMVTIRLAEAVQKRHGRVAAYELPHGADDADVRALLAACEDADHIIIGTINADHDAAQAELVNALLERGQMPIVVALRTPYDLLAFPNVPVYLCAYGIRQASVEAVARVLFGEIEAKGVLPCAIPGIAPAGSMTLERVTL